MRLDEESQSFTMDQEGRRYAGGSSSGCLKTVFTSCVTSLLTCLAAGFVLYNVYPCNMCLRQTNQTSDASLESLEASTLPQTQRLYQERDSKTALYGRFTIQEQQLYDKKNNSSISHQDAPENYMLNWTQYKFPTNVGKTSQDMFQTDANGCVILPQTGHWLVHSEVTFAYGHSSPDQIWVYIQINNSSMMAKKIVTLPGKQHRSISAHLPVDITDVIYLNKMDTLCVQVSDWRTVYASEIDNSLSLVYLPTGQ